MMYIQMILMDLRTMTSKAGTNECEHHLAEKFMWKLRQALLNDPSYGLFGVAESWLGSEVDECLINIQGYSAIRQDRNLVGVKYSLR